MADKEFKINDFLTLKLENDETVIYVAGKKFIQCKYLLLNLKRGKSYKEIRSIDEAKELLDTSLEGKTGEIPPETEFWGHCSNLQAWAENDYDTRLVHSNLAFPLLNELTKAGDSVARRVFKDEIAKRIEEGNQTTITYLIKQKYLEYLSKEELDSIDWDKITPKLDLNSLKKLFDSGYSKARDVLRQKIISIVEKGDKKEIEDLITEGYLAYLNEEELKKIDWSDIKIKSLSLSNKKFKGLPFYITKLEQLEKLDLTYCHLGSLPESIGQLKNLKELRVPYCDLKSLPETIGKLEKLKKLYLEYNQLESLPESIGQLKKLKELNLQHNKLSDQEKNKIKKLLPKCKIQS